MHKITLNKASLSATVTILVCYIPNLCYKYVNNVQSQMKEVEQSKIFSED